MFSPSLGISLESESLQVIGWGARGFDAGGGSAQQIFQRIQPVLRPGAIVLLHPERRPEALQALELLLKWIKDHGYRCVIPSVERLNAEARAVCAW
jgi:peptidoglycan/xylan/chitin deacetylase (PgdA/CDA1 family)